MKKYTLIALALCALLAAGALYALTATQSVGQTELVPAEAENNPNCPRDIFCLDIYEPVVCNDGVVYPNECLAYRECANGCKPL